MNSDLAPFIVYGILIIGLLAFCAVLMGVIYFLTRRAKLDFSFEVGDKEKHTVKLISETMFGGTKIYIDGVRQAIKFKLINGDSKHEITVGDKEKHKVEFHIKMPFLYGAYRKRSCTVSVDGKEIKTFESGSKIS